MGLEGLKFRRSWLNTWIDERISKKHQNVKIAIYGPPGSGKSYIGLMIGLSSDLSFRMDHVTGDLLTFGKLALDPASPNGSVWMWDDAGLDMTPEEWESKGAKFLSFLFQGSRNLESEGALRNHVYIITVPAKRFLIARIRYLFDFVLEATDVQGWAKPFIPFESPRDDGRIWKRYPKDGKGRQVKLIEFGMPPKELWVEYEAFRAHNNMEKMRNALEEARISKEMKAMKEENEIRRQQVMKTKLEVKNASLNLQFETVRLRKEGLTQQQIAAKTGFAQSKVSKLLSEQ